MTSVCDSPCQLLLIQCVRTFSACECTCITAQARATVCALADGPHAGQHGSAALPYAFMLVVCQHGCMWAPQTVEDGGAAVACLPGCWQKCGIAAPAAHVHQSKVRLNSSRAPGARRSGVHPHVHTCSFFGVVSEQPCLGLARRAHAPCLGHVRRCLKA